LAIDLSSSQAGQDVGDFTMHQVAAVELGRDRDGEAQLSPRLLHSFPLRNCSNEITAKHYKRLNAAVYYSFAGFHRVHSLFAWRLKGKLPGKAIQRNQFRLFRDTDGALALNV
jgi:hypothetical protein